MKPQAHMVHTLAPNVEQQKKEKSCKAHHNVHTGPNFMQELSAKDSYHSHAATGESYVSALLLGW